MHAVEYRLGGEYARRRHFEDAAEPAAGAGGPVKTAIGVLGEPGGQRGPDREGCERREHAGGRDPEDNRAVCDVTGGDAVEAPVGGRQQRALRHTAGAGGGKREQLGWSPTDNGDSKKLAGATGGCRHVHAVGPDGGTGGQPDRRGVDRCKSPVRRQAVHQSETKCRSGRRRPIEVAVGSEDDRRQRGVAYRGREERECRLDAGRRQAERGSGPVVGPAPAGGSIEVPVPANGQPATRICAVAAAAKRVHGRHRRRWAGGIDREHAAEAARAAKGGGAIEPAVRAGHERRLRQAIERELGEPLVANRKRGRWQHEQTHADTDESNES